MTGSTGINGGCGKRQVGEKADQAGHVEPLFAFRKRATELEILDILGPDTGFLDQSPDHLGGEIVGPDFHQGALVREGER